MAAKIGKRRATAKPRATTRRTGLSGGGTTTTRTRRGRAKSGAKKAVTRTHTRSAMGASTQRKATTRTKGGLKRTAKVSKTTTGTGANRVTKTRRVVTRIKNGRKVKRVITRVNRGGNVSTRTATKVSGKGPRSTTPQRHGTTPTRNGGTTAPRPKAKARPAKNAPAISHRSAASPTRSVQTSGLNRAKPAPKKKGR